MAAPNVRRSLRMVTIGISACVLVAVTVQSAAAWTWATRVTLYDAAGLCVQGDAGIDHFNPDVYFSGNLAYDGVYALGAGCVTGLNLPNGWAAVRLDVFRWNGSAWAVCRSTGWKYGATGSSQWGPWGPGEAYNYGGSAACGAGYYGTQSTALIWDGSAWRGGSLWSGYEYVP